MPRKPNLLAILPRAWAGLWQTRLADGSAVTLFRHGEETYDPAAIDYALSFRPPQGLLKSLSNLKAVFSMGAGVDGFFAHGDYPAEVPLIRFCDPTLTVEMAQYVLMHALIHHRGQRALDEGQTKAEWRQAILPRRTENTGVGILGLGEIGLFTARRFADLGFRVSGWSRGRKDIPGIACFAGAAELPEFLSRADIAVCLLPLTGDTKGILNARLFAAMPKGGFVVNVARGGHLNEAELIEALDSDHLSGAALDVFAIEPLPRDSKLWRHPKITVTPHVAAISQPAVAAEYVLSGIAQFEKGEMPENVVDVTRGY
jgi:glyoxylate/hydroxypyruvate reductase